MKKISLLTMIILLSANIFSQVPTFQGRQGRGQNFNIGRFYGKIVDSATGKGIEAASVQLLQSRFDSATKTRKNVNVNGQLTAANGDFSLESLSPMGQYILRISAIGFKTVEKKVSFDIKFGQGQDMQAMMSALDKDLGNISLQTDARMLGEVVVVGSAPTLKLEIDRKVFNVEKSITSTGGTAVDVMRNIPSLDVDVDGNVSLRNQAPQIYVDGRPTTFTLDQIPADAISTVELITNPSAKFDASGGQTGILNIVLKKNKKVGYNGGLRSGIDSRGRFNGGLDFSVRQGKINFFASGMYNQRKSRNWGYTDITYLSADPVTRTHEDMISWNNGHFAFGRFGFDYLIDNRNTLTITQAIVRGSFDNDQTSNYRVDTLNSQGEYETQYRITNGDFGFRSYRSQVSFKHSFTKPGKEWTADLNLDQSKNDNNSDIRYRSFLMDGSPKTSEFTQGIVGDGKNKYFTAQTDYVNPINERMKWETGARAQVRTFSSKQYNYTNGIFLPQISNEYKYTDYVFAAYAIYSHQLKDNFSYQVGLRAESSSYDGTQNKPGQATKQSFKQDFPVSLFPSIFFTKQLKNEQDLQLNYSRRINRPSFFQLMPNTDFSDPLNYSTGNPDLKPEFTNSLELSYQKTFKDRSNFLATLFFKNTNNLISRFQEKRLLGSDSVFVSTWVNADRSYAAGLELTSRVNIAKWWEATPNVNIYYSKIDGSNVEADLQNERVSWFGKLNNNFKLPKSWTVQLSGDYRSKSVVPIGDGGGFRGGWGMRGFSTTQGYTAANYGVDIAVRKDWKIKKTNTLTATINMSDIFRTRRSFIHSESGLFIQDYFRRRDPQIVRLNLSYRFGKFDTNLFKRRNNRGQGDDMGDIQMMQQ